LKSSLSHSAGPGYDAERRGATGPNAFSAESRSWSFGIVKIARNKVAGRPRELLPGESAIANRVAAGG